MSQEPPPSLDPAPPPPPPPPTYAPAKPGVSGATIAIIAILLVVIAGAAFFFSRGGGFGGSSGGPEAAANAFFKTNGDNGPTTSYASTAPAFRDATPEVTWATISARMALAAYNGADWGDKDVANGVASLHGTLHRLNLPDLKAAVELRQIDGAWKVLSVSIQDPAAMALNPQGTAPGLAPQVQPQPGYPTPQTVSPPPSTDPNAPPANTQANAAPMSSLPTPGPVMSVPRSLPLGRPGPPGVAMASGQVGPECMSPLWKMGFHADEVRCPLYLPTIPGRTELCTAHATDGRVGTVTVTFLDYDPITRRGTFDCHLN